MIEGQLAPQQAFEWLPDSVIAPTLRLQTLLRNCSSGLIPTSGDMAASYYWAAAIIPYLDAFALGARRWAQLDCEGQAVWLKDVTDEVEAGLRGRCIKSQF